MGTSRRTYGRLSLDGLVVCQPPGHLEMDKESVINSGMADEGTLVGEEAV